MQYTPIVNYIPSKEREFELGMSNGLNNNPALPKKLIMNCETKLLMWCGRVVIASSCKPKYQGSNPKRVYVGRYFVSNVV